MNTQLLQKLASISKKAKMSDETKNEILHTGTIFGAGIAGTAASTILGKRLGWSDSVKKMTALGGAAALATDFAAVKANKHIGGDHSKQASLANKYLNKIVNTNKG
jgi:hypothetical protein